MKDAAEARRSRLLLVCGVPVALLIACGTIGVAMSPMLLARAPLLLVAMSPLFRHVVVASPSVDALPLFAVTVPRHFAPDPFLYVLGREFGPLAILWMEANSPGIGRSVRWLERLFARVGPLALLLSPDLIVSTFAGVARVPVATFVVMNVTGTIGMVVVARWFGAALQAPIARMVAYFEGHLAEVTIASALIVVLANWWSRRSRGADGG